MTDEQRRVLEFARHQLVSLTGLIAADGEAASETWEIDESVCIGRIDEVLAASMTLSERIEAAFDEAIEQLNRMLLEQGEIAEREENIQAKNAEAWASAKNNYARRTLIQQWLEDDAEYLNAVNEYSIAHKAYRLALLEIERLKVLTSLERA